MAVHKIEVEMAQPKKAPVGSVKWKALFDRKANKILFRNTNEPELMSWMGIVRPSGKEYTFTTIPVTNEQKHGIISNIEAQVAQILSENEWSQNFHVMSTERIFPKTDNCIYYEKQQDGQLHPVNPDVEGGELRNSSEKSLQVGALLQVNGVSFDFANDTAKLTFKLVTAVYSWSQHETTSELASTYLTMFGPIASEKQSQISTQMPPLQEPFQALQQPMDIIEVSGNAATQPQPRSLQRKKRNLQKEKPMDAVTHEWDPPNKKVKPLRLQRQDHADAAFKVQCEQSNNYRDQLYHKYNNVGEQEVDTA